jgi:hypothetical protein
MRINATTSRHAGRSVFAVMRDCAELHEMENPDVLDIVHI